MAKKVNFDDPDIDNLDGLDDLDFGGDDLFPDDDSDSRNPVTEFKRSAISSFKDSILKRDNIKRLISSTIGTGFADAIDTYDELSAAVVETVGANEQQGRSLIRDITGIVDESSPKASRFIPDWLRKEADKAEDEYVTPGAPEEGDSELDASIKGIDDLLNFTKRIERDRVARDSANRLKDVKIADANVKGTSTLIGAVRRLSNYQEKVTLNYQRKSLEQGYRIINLLAKTHQLHMAQYGVMNEALSSIQKNTGLPDFVKMQSAEFVKEGIKKRIADATVNRLSLGIKPIVDRIKGQVGDAIAGFGMVTDQMKVGDGVSPATMIGSMAGDALGNLGSRVLGSGLSRTMPYIQKIPGYENVEKANNLLSRYGNDLPMLLNTLAEEGHSNPYLDELIRFVSPDSRSIDLKKTGMEELDDPSYFDIRTHRTINDIIPAYLASMDRHIIKLATGEMGEERRWDHFTGTLDTSSSVLSNVMSQGIKDGSLDKPRYEVDNLLDSMGAWSLSSDTKSALRIELTRRLIKGVQFKPEMFMKEEMWKEYPPHVASEIQGFLMERFGLTPEGKFESTDAETRFWDFHKEEYVPKSKQIADYTSRFKEYTNLTGSAPWVDSGIVTRDKDGSYKLNETAFLKELLNPSDEYSYRGTTIKEEETILQNNERRKRYSDLGKGILSKLTPWKKDKDEVSELRDIVHEQESQSLFDDDEESTSIADKVRGWWGSVSQKTRDSSISTQLINLKNQLTVRSLDEILDGARARYDETFTREKAEETRNFLLNTKLGQKTVKYLRDGEESILSGSLESLKVKPVSQTSDGFARDPQSIPTGPEDIGTHERLDQLNEIQLAQQVILTELLEVTSQLPYLIHGADTAGLNDPVVRNRQTRMMRLSQFMRTQGQRIRNSKVGKLSTSAAGMLGTGAQSAWSGIGLLGRGLRGTMGLAVKAGSLASRGTVGLVKSGANAVGNALSGIGRGIGSIASGYGALGGGLLRTAGMAIPGALSGAMSLGKGVLNAAGKVGGLVGAAATSPFRAVGMLTGMLTEGKDEYRDYDAYVKGEEQPRIVINKMKMGLYKDMDGNEIKSLDQINGPLYDENDNVVISEIEYASKLKLYSLSGKLLTTLGDSLLGKGRIASGIRRVLRPVRKLTGGISSAIKGILSAPFKLLGGVSSRIRSAVQSSDKAELPLVIAHEQLGIQTKIYQLLSEKLKRGSSNDEPDENSWEGIQRARSRRGETTLADIKESLDKYGEKSTDYLGEIVDNTDDKKDGIFSRILSSITSLGGILGTGLGKLGGLMAGTKVGSTLLGGAKAAGSFVARRGIMGAALVGAKAIGATVLGVVGAPALAIAGVALAAAAGGYFLYKGYKSGQVKKMHLMYIRMLEYGVNPTDEDAVGKIAALESEWKKYVQVRTTTEGDKRNVTDVAIDTQSIKLESIFALFGIDWEEFKENVRDKDHPGNKLIDWIENRFIPVYRSHVHAGYEATGSIDISELDSKVVGSKGLKYLSTTKTVQIDYFKKTKYGSPSAAFKDRKSSPFYSNWFRKDVWADEEDIQEAYDRAEVHFRSQENKTSVSTDGIKAPVAGRIDQRLMTNMKEQSTLVVSNDGTTDLAEINRDLKGSGFFTSIQSANNFIRGDEYSMTWGLKRLDTGSAIRYMAYGLKKMEMVKVEQLWSLEKYVLDLIPYGVKWFQYPESIYEKALSVFAPETDDGKKDLKLWLYTRFLPVLEHYFHGLVSHSTTDPSKAWTTLNARKRWDVIKNMLEMITRHPNKEREGETYSVWTIEASPWLNYTSNTDPSSVADYLRMLEKDMENVLMEVEGAKTLLTGNLIPTKPITLPGGTELQTFSLFDTDYLKRTLGDKPTPRTGADLLTKGQITSSGKPHAPLPGHGNEEGERALLQAIKEAGITDPNEIAMIMGQVSEETGRFTRIEENLNYRADRMMQVWPSRFRHKPDFARKLADAGPEAIANEIYGDRMGNTEPGDGWKYRGRGYIQLTGKDNYRKIGDYLGIDLVNNPDLVNSSPEMAAKTAVAYWMTRGNGIRAAAQRGDVRQVTRLVNGGETGLNARRQHVAHYTRALPELMEKVNETSSMAASSTDSDQDTTLQAPQGLSTAFAGTVPGATTSGAVRPPVAAQVASEAPASETGGPTTSTLRDAHATLIRRQRSQQEETRSRVPDVTDREVQVTVSGDEETKGLMGEQLNTQQMMVNALMNIEKLLADQSEGLQPTNPTKTNPTRSVPPSTRNTG